jgi:hypothetical protein
MATQNKSSLLVSLFLVTAGILLLPFISSCGKGANANSSGLNTQLQILNLSPDAGSLNLYLNYIKESTSTYTYTTNSGYFYLSTLQPPLQLRTATTAPINVLTIDSALKANAKYTLFITGYRTDKDTSIKNSILSLDTATLPALGRGKVRFVNASPSSPTLDLRANDTLVVGALDFNKVSSYTQLPVGNYNFTISANKTPTKIEASILNVTIQDGRAYTIYTQGIVGRTDSVAFGAGVLTNNLLLKTTQ